VNQPEELNYSEESSPEFERQLTHALRQVDPPAGFADRILARAESPAEPQTPTRAKVVAMPSRLRLWTSGALAATLLVAAVLTQQTHERHERERAEVAQQQFDAAMRITDQTLEHVRQQLQQAGVQIGN
jgi:hypothetical protein